MNETGNDRRTSGDDALLRWQRKQAHYQDPAVVARYDAERGFARDRATASTRWKWAAIERHLLRELPAGARVLDVPCGTGRFTRAWLGADVSLVNADLSLAMLAAARDAGGAHSTARGGLAGSVRCDAGHLPFADASFDAVVSVRFLFHVPRQLRAAFLREYARVSRRFVLVDVRHKYCWTTQSKRLRAWLTRARAPTPRYSLRDIDADLAAAGLVQRARLWRSPLFSEKMLVVCEKR
ncbi:MAG: class I SAM-dependent methyltransferase [Planctomycetota bacterium]